jgi:predicted nuclease with TOPRIM domain
MAQQQITKTSLILKNDLIINMTNLTDILNNMSNLFWLEHDEHTVSKDKLASKEAYNFELKTNLDEASARIKHLEVRNRQLEEDLNTALNNYNFLQNSKAKTSLSFKERFYKALTGGWY